MEQIALGDEVKDKISGFRGIAVARYSYLHGCERISVQPKIDKQGKLPESRTFDEPQLMIIKNNLAKRGKGDRGGPAPYMPKPRPEGRR